MKIIKPGRDQAGWAKEYVCTGAGNGGGGCGAILLVEEKDLYQTSRSDYLGDTDYYVTFKCCSCGVETDINDCPKNARDLPKKRKGKTWKCVWPGCENTACLGRIYCAEHKQPIEKGMHF